MVCVCVCACMYMYHHHYSFPFVYLCLALDNLPKYLSEFGIKDGTRLTADDFLQNYTLIINIIHRYIYNCRVH